MRIYYYFRASNGHFNCEEDSLHPDFPPSSINPTEDPFDSEDGAYLCLKDELNEFQSNLTPISSSEVFGIEYEVGLTVAHVKEESHFWCPQNVRKLCYVCWLSWTRRWEAIRLLREKYITNGAPSGPKLSDPNV